VHGAHVVGLDEEFLIAHDLVHVGHVAVDSSSTMVDSTACLPAACSMRAMSSQSLLAQLVAARAHGLAQVDDVHGVSAMAW
jgi:hypothetical protein